MKYYGIGTILLGLVAGTVQADPVQWSVADGGNGHWYMVEEYGLHDSWSAAQASALAQGGYLATVTSTEENSFVTSLYSSVGDSGSCDSCSSGSAALLGGTQDSKGGWAWVTGESWEFEDWYPGEPNSLDETVLYLRCPGQWNDGSDTLDTPCRYAGIIEWDPSPVQWRIEDGGNGHWYELVVSKSTVTWNEANSDAESRGGYLATATSGAENQWIFDTFDLDDYDSYWDTASGTGPALGALWNVKLQAWEWNTGETWDYENWREGQDQPNPPDADWGMSYSTLDGVPTPSNLWQHVPVNGGIVHVSYVIEFTTLPGSALGACCLDGLCITTAAADCSGNSGSWGGPDSSCADFDCPVSCPGDLDGDGIVKVQDLLILIANWGVCP